MTIKAQLDQILEKWDLLKHPFYQAWSAGTLPMEALRLYAQEYGAFINTLPRGWESVDDASTAREEREHATFWDDFTAAIGGVGGEPSLIQTEKLARDAAQLLATPVSALGALYAFEAQQPATAASKLEGLKAHYQVPEAAAKYFELHSTNGEESAKILAQIQGLPPALQEQALLACEQMAESLWTALTGIYKTCSD